MTSISLSLMMATQLTKAASPPPKQPGLLMQVPIMFTIKYKIKKKSNLIV
jgi:hypothetical protein